MAQKGLMFSVNLFEQYQYTADKKAQSRGEQQSKHCSFLTKHNTNHNEKLHILTAHSTFAQKTFLFIT